MWLMSLVLRFANICLNKIITFILDQAITTPFSKVQPLIFCMKLSLIFRFGKVERQTETFKTNDPGPGSYNVLDTVGVLKGYEAEERVPREVYLDQKTSRLEA